MGYAAKRVNIPLYSPSVRVQPARLPLDGALLLQTQRCLETRKQEERRKGPGCESSIRLAFYTPSAAHGYLMLYVSCLYCKHGPQRCFVRSCTVVNPYVKSPLVDPRIRGRVLATACRATSIAVWTAASRRALASGRVVTSRGLAPRGRAVPATGRRVLTAMIAAESRGAIAARGISIGVGTAAAAATTTPATTAPRARASASTLAGNSDLSARVANARKDLLAAVDKLVAPLERVAIDLAAVVA
jgi:hypothetical protein